jgi:hypothetical protein
MSTTFNIHHDQRGLAVVPRSLSSGEQRVLAAFLAGRLPAGRLEAELARARCAPRGPAQTGAVGTPRLRAA